MSSEKPRQQIYDSTAPSTDTREARMGAGPDDRFNSKLREAFGSTPFILTKFDQFMNWVRGNSMFMLQFGIACCSIVCASCGVEQVTTRRPAVCARHDGSRTRPPHPGGPAPVRRRT